MFKDVSTASQTLSSCRAENFQRLSSPEAYGVESASTTSGNTLDLKDFVLKCWTLSELSSNIAY